VMVCKNSTALDFDEKEAKKILKDTEVTLHVDLNSGDFSDRMWTCDLTGDYVKINGSYRS
jgi:glutamate N-acetyltransferase / amino-acid N-acetyltransferase